jgi:hypothetical protein
MLRQLPRLCRSLSTTDAHISSTSASIVTASSPPTVESPRSGQTLPAPPPTQTAQSTQPIHSSQPTQSDHFSKLVQSAHSAQTTPNEHPTADDAILQTTSYAQPPFRTHRVFTALERSFPPSTARSIMRATLSLLVDRMDNVKRTSLTRKDLENVHPFFL